MAFLAISLNLFLGTPFADDQADAAPATFVIEGGGWGHGVGMSQYGAYGMAADLAATYTQILSHYYTSTQVQTATQPSNIRVLLSSNPGATSVAGGENIYFFENGTTLIASAPANYPIGLTIGNGAVVVSAGGNQPWVVAASPGAKVTLTFGTSPLVVSSTGDRYNHGHLVISPDGSNVQIVAAGLSMDEYLYGLGEMPSSWPVEALKAQAVAARSYAKFAIDQRRNDPTRSFDLFASVQDQAYIGYEKQAGSGSFWARWKSAVDDTSDRVATYNGSVIQAFYYSSSGGRTENSENVFAAVVPYLKGVDDPYDSHQNPNYRWTRSYAAGDLSRWLNRFSDTTIGTLTNLSFDPPTSFSGRINKTNVVLTGTQATKTVTGSRFQAVVNSGVNNDGLGRSSQLLSTYMWLPRPMLAGSFDIGTQVPGGLAVGGWALDTGTSEPITVTATINGTSFGLGLAQLERADVGALYPTAGSAHGFNVAVPYGPGAHQVCLSAVAKDGSATQPLGCKTVVINPEPIGSFDLAAREPGGIHVGGWAIDPDTASPTDVHIYIDSTGYVLSKVAGNRADIGQAYPPWGSAHGFDAVLPTAPGTHRVCAYAINTIGPGNNQLLGCKTAVVTVDPIGSYDWAVGGSGSVTVAGWVIDPDTSAPASVHVFVDGVAFNGGAADIERPDVGSVYRAWGANHGYLATIATSRGTHNVCVAAINVSGLGNNQLLGCRSVTAS